MLKGCGGNGFGSQKKNRNDADSLNTSTGQRVIKGYQSDFLALFRSNEFK
jgi:hypothetical protein